MSFVSSLNLAKKLFGITCVLASVSFVHSAQAQTNVLYLGLSKNVSGTLAKGATTSWKVTRDNKQIEMFHTVVEGALHISTGDSADDDLPKALNGDFKLHLELTGRSGNQSFGTIAGKHVWTDGVNTIEGYLVGNFGCNPIRKPLITGEKDASPGVIHGTLSGEFIAGPMKGDKVQASFAGKITTASPTDLKPRIILNIDGVIVIPATNK